jgi:hypothetical protein
MKEEGTAYLPDNATSIIKNAVPRKKPIKGFSEPLVEVYPNNPIHTMDNKYPADKIKDKDVTGGLTHITCINSITKGFNALHRGESPNFNLRFLGPN